MANAFLEACATELKSCARLSTEQKVLQCIKHAMHCNNHATSHAIDFWLTLAIDIMEVR